MNTNWGVVIHGGAIFNNYVNHGLLSEMNIILEKGISMLKHGESSLKVCEEVIKLMEDSGKFNAGKGSMHLNDTNKVEMDSTLMDGKTKRSGNVVAISNVKNPIKVSRFLMSYDNPITYVLCGKGAHEFAMKNGLKHADDSYFKESISKSTGTVGCVVCDIYNNLSAGTSTGGISNKLPGRVGDSGIVGTGTYADNDTCAVSCTGVGEKIINQMIGHDLSCKMKYGNMNLKDASIQLINALRKGTGGFISIDKNSNISMQYNSNGMYRCMATSTIPKKFFIFKTEIKPILNGYRSTLKNMIQEVSKLDENVNTSEYKKVLTSMLTSPHKEPNVKYFKNTELENDVNNIVSFFNEKFITVLTVPHNLCRNTVYRTCDTVAGNAAKLIEHYLDVEGIDYKSFYGDRFRDEIDLNRKVSRKTLFRKRISKYVTSEKSKLFVLDVHSFPNVRDRFSYNYDMYVLDDNPEFTDYVINFKEYMKSKGIKIGLFKGKAGENDIIDEMISHGIDSFLVEFNEELFSKSKEKICRNIAKWIKMYYYSKFVST